jgi:5-methylcytosine-specific restriction endonuclease McrBC regulatory subunit McrC
MVRAGDSTPYDLTYVIEDFIPWCGMVLCQESPILGRKGQKSILLFPLPPELWG